VTQVQSLFNITNTTAALKKKVQSKYLMGNPMWN